jgi:acyl carrier protein
VTRPTTAANATSANREQFTDSLVTFIRDELRGGNAVAVDADTYLFEQGVIDSLKILRLIAFVEHWTGAAIADSEIVMGNFRSVRRIAEHFVR